MYLSGFATFLLAVAPLVLSSPLLPREDERLDEAVFLTTCFKYMKSNDATPNGRDDKLWYFKNYDDSIKGQQFDEAYASNPGDPNHPVDWTSGTERNPITGTLDKKPFKVWGLTEMGDGKTFVTGYADLGGAPMRCYNNSASHWKQDYGEKMYVKCSAKYYCTRNSRQVRRTIVTTSSTMQSIPFLGQQNYDVENDHGVQEQVKNAFLWLKDHYKSNAADGEGYKIGSKDYKMTYAVNRMEKEGDPYYEADRINQVADLVVERVFPELWAKDSISDERAWPSGSKILAEATHTLPFPKQIKVQVQVAEQAMLDWEDRDTVVFTVEKGNECKVDSVLSLAIKGAFKAVSAATTGGVSAVANGLGLVVGELAAGAC
ncbi:uncharacterized protein Bfra_007365 [Botrytis fragariae]|uniref:Uncharacterized protein n=1 Tax=Botrytis fragariae TaxID=1964551 RepID=A0A8H6EDE9_9HELO|nr:uncharacterized protein Bfra_007365 [Botrytis fragariae]KAF5868169.1 hypothetical protein Bfra_007365 [Botrytis fragariae]